MKKLHRQFFWLLIFLLPVQLGRHFWFEWTQVLGLAVDYLSPTLYLTDLLVIAILLTWWWQEKIRDKRYEIRDKIQKNWVVGAIFIFLLVNSFLAVNRGAAFYKLIKVLEFTFLGFYIAKSNYTLYAIRYPLSLAVVYSSLIAIFQFVKQASLGGIFWWLGERNFNIITPGIAKAIINGRLVLRPYATFSHPNVLAGFFLVAIILLLGNFKLTNQLINKLKKNWSIGIYWILVFILALIGLVLSFSRATWLIGLLVGFGLVTRSWWGKKRRVAGLIFLLVLIGVFYYRFALPLSGQETLTQRFSLAQIAIEMIKASPLAGVGLNNFIPRLPDYWQQFGMTYWLQPVHNVFLLIAAETGLVGLLIFLWLLVLIYKRLLVTGHWSLIVAVSIIFALGLFDHYWLTLQQSQLLLTIVFGLSWRR
ncbi:O-antigen ligase family protein [Patescibacteria group bacterium]|nr:O-antigen ligase family protein [Patescibacteria group bacterium]